ncbi:MAG TPA: hypothetical protein VLY63_15195, partial [Anaerolineae bacterium]|nr:hypothetical protein [Anaerolineae bacterium]
VTPIIRNFFLPVKLLPISSHLIGESAALQQLRCRRGAVGDDSAALQRRIDLGCFQGGLVVPTPLGVPVRRGQSTLSADCTVRLAVRRESSVDDPNPIYSYKLRKRLQQQPA